MPDTVFVVGAGASTEAGESMPVGEELTKSIANVLDIRYEWHQDARESNHRRNAANGCRARAT